MALDFKILAAEMETQLAQRKGPLPDLGKKDREDLFEAIAQAVVEHFQREAVIEVNDVNLNQNPAPGTIR